MQFYIPNQHKGQHLMEDILNFLNQTVKLNLIFSSIP